MSEWPNSLALGPIRQWPGTRTPSHERASGKFRAALADTLDVLDRELHHIQAVEARMEIALPPGSDYWRNDGRPRAHARPDHPGVLLTFRALAVDGKRLNYATDAFTTWQANLRAIALGLEALRKVERYRIASRGQQYAGFAQLTAGGPDADRGRELIRWHGGVRQALMATHPDQGGDPGDFANVQAARDQGAS